MKALIILSLTIVSLNVFAAENGEVLKSDCAASNQSNKREPKQVDVQTDVKDEKPASSAVKK